MGKARIATPALGVSPRKLAALLRSLLTIVAALVSVILLDAIGVVAAIDEGVQRRYVENAEAIGASRETTEPIVIVAGDRDTVEAWGPPPWPAERLVEIVEQIEPGKPDLIAELGHGRMFVSDDSLRQFSEARDDELMLHDDGDSLRTSWSGVGLDGGDLVLPRVSRLAELAERSDRLPAVPERLPVRWLTPAARLPVLPAHQVASGKIPARTFAGRVVVLGVTDTEHVMAVATPIGRLSPIEVEAHALTGLADGVVWAELPIVWSHVGCGLLACVLLLLFWRSQIGGAAILMLVGALVLLAIDFGLYSRGVVRLGLGRPLSCMAVTFAGYWLSEATAAFAGLRRLRAKVLHEVSRVASSERESWLDAEGLWSELAELGSEYAQELLGSAAASTLLERVGWSLEPRASARLDPEIQARIAAHPHLDLRRAPFRAAWLTRRANITTTLLEQPTLIVPIEHDAELLGLWLVHLDDRATPDQIATFERLGRQMAQALSRRSELAALRDRADCPRAREQIETIVGGLRLLRDEHRWALELLEQLPVRAMIATVWGELEFVDPRLRDELAGRYPDLFDPDEPAQNLRELLARMTGKSLADAHRLMRKVVRTGVAIELDLVVPDASDVWVLSRIRSERGLDLPGFKPAVHEHILLMARSSVPAKTVETRSGALLRVLGGS